MSDHHTNTNSKAMKAFLSLALIFASIYPSLVFAVATPDAASMLSNLADTVPQFMKLVTAMAYVTGMFLIIRGLIGLKQYGESRTMMSSQQDLKGPLILMAVGTALLYLPTSVTAGLTTFWTDPNPYGYEDHSSDQWATLIQNCFLVVQLIGTIAFIRGLLILTQLGGHAQPGTLSKGVTHIIAGALCINLYDFINAINNTLGIGNLT